jgi:two-component system, NtrC family, sensor kinase
MGEPPSPRASARPDATASKAKLLLQRERELYELRHLRSRAEEWFTALHAVWPERFDVELDVLARRATDLLVGGLSFEYAAAFEYRVETGELVFACSDPLPLPAGVRIERAAADYFEGNAAGRFDGSQGEPLVRLAESLGLAKFFWRWCSSYRGTRFLFLAGSSPRTAMFHTFPDTDRDHFAMFTSHAAALLSNSLLVADVRREQEELEAANRGLDNSLKELEQTQAKLLASTQMVALASREAGMAEIATGILHNVGNVFNSVNVCSEVALERVNALPIDGLGRVVELLWQQPDLPTFFARDPRGPKTIEYLARLSRTLVEERTLITSELEQLVGHLAHVAAIVSRQQAYAKSGNAERCVLAELMDDALLLTHSGGRQDSVEVIKAFTPAPDVFVDRHRVLQILVNLITNALQALNDSARPDKRLIAHIGVTEERLVRLAIEDNGVGIAPEHAARLFQHGFTTRANGHGFGLHNSALTAQELGGALSFESAGLGRGARFILELPVSRAEPRGASRAPRTASREIVLREKVPRETAHCEVPNNVQE